MSTVDKCTKCKVVIGNLPGGTGGGGGMLPHDLGGAFHNADTLADINTKVSDGILIDGAIIKSPTGFVDLADSIFSFSDSSPDRTFTIQPTGSSFDYYISATKYNVSSPDSVQITNTEGFWLIYYDGATLTASQTIPTDLYTNKVPVAWVYWDATNLKQIILGDKRFVAITAVTSREYIHDIVGTQVSEGMAPTDLQTEQSGDSNSHAQVGVAAGILYRDDTKLNVTAVLSTDNKYVYYRDGASGNWRIKDTDSFPVINFSGGSNLLAWNEFTGSIWQQTEVSNTQYVLCHCFGADDKSRDNSFYIQGQNDYISIIEAREGAASEINSLLLGGIPFKEITPLFTLIYQTSTGYSNTPQARTREVETGQDFIDWRGAGRVFLGTGGITTLHNDLAGRDVLDCHPASSIDADTTNFSNNLSSADDTVQKALETIDDISHTKREIDLIPDTNLDYYGDWATVTVDTNTQGIGAPLTLAADGNFDESDANVANFMPCTVLALETGTGSKRVLLKGSLRNDAWSWTLGVGQANTLYVSTTSGQLTQTAPTLTGEYVQKVGWAIATNAIYFDPDSTLIVRN